ncbi:MAG: hypothetical protein FWG64_03925, partial [Firmicutes bacterium]|nr:hypothetical protein [Bacillota bacterium]
GGNNGNVDGEYENGGNNGNVDGEDENGGNNGNVDGGNNGNVDGGNNGNVDGGNGETDGNSNVDGGNGETDGNNNVDGGNGESNGNNNVDGGNGETNGNSNVDGGNSESNGNNNVDGGNGESNGNNNIDGGNGGTDGNNNVDGGNSDNISQLTMRRFPSPIRLAAMLDATFLATLNIGGRNMISEMPNSQQWTLTIYGYTLYEGQTIRATQSFMGLTSDVAENIVVHIDGMMPTVPTPTPPTPPIDPGTPAPPPPPAPVQPPQQQVPPPDQSEDVPIQTPRPGPASTPIPRNTPTPTPVATVAPTATPTITPTATPVITPLPTATPYPIITPPPAIAILPPLDILEIEEEEVEEPQEPQEPAPQAPAPQVAPPVQQPPQPTPTPTPTPTPQPTPEPTELQFVPQPTPRPTEEPVAAIVEEPPQPPTQILLDSHEQTFSLNANAITNNGGLYIDENRIPWILNGQNIPIIDTSILPENITIVEDEFGFRLYSSAPEDIARALQNGYTHGIHDDDGNLIAVYIGTYVVDDNGEVIFMRDTGIPLGAFVFDNVEPAATPWWVWLLLALLALLPFLLFLLLKRRDIMVEFVVKNDRRSYYQFVRRGAKVEYPEDIRLSVPIRAWFTKNRDGDLEKWDFSDKVRKDIVLYAENAHVSEGVLLRNNHNIDKNIATE